MPLSILKKIIGRISLILCLTYLHLNFIGGGRQLYIGSDCWAASELSSSSISNEERDSTDDMEAAPIVTVQEKIGSGLSYLEHSLAYWKYKSAFESNTGSASSGPGSIESSSSSSCAPIQLEGEDIRQKIATYKEQELNALRWQSISTSIKSNPKDSTIEINYPQYINPEDGKRYYFSWHNEEPYSSKYSDLQAIFKYLQIEREMVVKVEDQDYYEETFLFRKVKIPLIVYQFLPSSEKETVARIHQGNRIISRIVIYSNFSMKDLLFKRRQIVQNKILNFIKSYGSSVVERKLNDIKELLASLKLNSEKKKVVEGKLLPIESSRASAANTASNASTAGLNSLSTELLGPIFKESLLEYVLLMFRESKTLAEIRNSLILLETFIQNGASLHKFNFNQMESSYLPGVNLLNSAINQGMELLLSNLLDHPEIDKNNSAFSMVTFNRLILDDGKKSGNSIINQAALSGSPKIVELVLKKNFKFKLPVIQENLLGQDALSLTEEEIDKNDSKRSGDGFLKKGFKEVRELLSEQTNINSNPLEYIRHILLQLKLNIKKNNSLGVKEILLSISKFKSTTKGEQIIERALKDINMKWNDFLLLSMDSWPNISNANNPQVSIEFLSLIRQLLLTGMKWNEEILNHDYINTSAGAATIFDQLIKMQDSNEKFLPELLILIIKEVNEWASSKKRISFYNGESDLQNEVDLKYRYTPLQLATIYLHSNRAVDTMRYILIQEGIEINKIWGKINTEIDQKGTNFSSPLYQAVDALDLEKVKLLLKYNADCTYIAYPGAKTPLEHAKEIADNSKELNKKNQARAILNTLLSHMITPRQLDKYQSALALYLLKEFKIKELLMQSYRQDNVPTKVLLWVQAFKDVTIAMESYGLKRDSKEYYQLIDYLLTLPLSELNGKERRELNISVAAASSSVSTSSVSSTSSADTSSIGSFIIKNWENINNSSRTIDNLNVLSNIFVSSKSEGIYLRLLRSQFEQAINDMQVRKVEELIMRLSEISEKEKDKILNGSDEYGSSLISMAGDMLYKTGCIYQGGDDEKRKTLFSILSLVLSAGAKIDESARIFSMSDKDRSLLYRAVFFQDKMLTSLVISAAKKSYPGSNEDGITKQKQFVNAIDQGGWFALADAAYGGNLELVEMLVKAGAEVNMQTKDKWTYSPLMAAAEKGHYQIIKFLFENESKYSKINLELISKELSMNALQIAEKYLGKESKVAVLIREKMQGKNSNIVADVTTAAASSSSAISSSSITTATTAATAATASSLPIQSSINNFEESEASKLKKIIISTRNESDNSDQLPVNASDATSSLVSSFEQTLTTANKSNPLIKKELWELALSTWADISKNQDSKSQRDLRHIITILLKNGASFDKRTLFIKARTSGRTLLHDGAIKNDIKLVEAILKDLGHKYLPGFSLGLLCFNFNHHFKNKSLGKEQGSKNYLFPHSELLEIKQILYLQEYLHSPDNNGQQALDDAANAGHQEIVEMLSELESTLRPPKLKTKKGAFKIPSVVSL